MRSAPIPSDRCTFMLSMSVSKLTAAPLPDPHGVRRHGHHRADSDPQVLPLRGERDRPRAHRHGRPGRQEPARRPSASYTVSRDVMWVNRFTRCGPSACCAPASSPHPQGRATLDVGSAPGVADRFERLDRLLAA